MPVPEQPDFDYEFERAIADWRERQRLREDDAALLLVDLLVAEPINRSDLLAKPSLELASDFRKAHPLVRAAREFWTMNPILKTGCATAIQQALSEREREPRHSASGAAHHGCDHPRIGPSWSRH